MKSQKSILVDVDGTIADIHTIFSSKISSDFNTAFSVEDITDWNFGGKTRTLGIDVKTCIDIMHNLWRSDWESVPLMDSFVVDAMSSLKTEYKVDIVTANESWESIKKWLLKNNVPHNNFLFHVNKHELDYDIFIEDNAQLHEKLRPSQILLLKDRPWNRSLKEKKNVIRFGSFDEVEGILKDLG